MGEVLERRVAIHKRLLGCLILANPDESTCADILLALMRYSPMSSATTHAPMSRLKSSQAVPRIGHIDLQYHSRQHSQITPYGTREIVYPRSRQYPNTP